MTENFLCSNRFAMAVADILGKNIPDDVEFIYDDPKLVKRDLIKCIDKIERTFRQNITSDIRLSRTTQLAIDDLREALRKNEPLNLGIIAGLLQLVALLLGFDHGSGKANRHVVYYQTRDQIAADVDYFTINGHKNRGVEGLKQSDIIQMLTRDGYKENQIALIMNLSVANVRTLIENHHLLEPMRSLLERDRNCD